MEEDNNGGSFRSLIDLVNDVASISDYRYAVRKQYCNLARRLKLLIPLFEEMRDIKQPLPDDTVRALASLKEALESTKELLRQGSEGSKIYLALDREQILNQFHEVTARLEQALNEISHEDLDISDEVKEQVELVLSQFRRARGRNDTQDAEVYVNLNSLYNNNRDSADPSILKVLAEKLQLIVIADLTQESLALHEMVLASDGDPGGRFEKMSILLKKIKDFMLTENPEIGLSSKEQSHPRTGGQVSAGKKDIVSLHIPEDFRCPISLDLMKDPVIVSTGQTYERAFIEKWLADGHSTCPKTQQVLTSKILTPNYVLRSLIAQWCEVNGIEPPQRSSSSQPSKLTPAERSKYEALLHKLASGNIEDKRSAAGEIRLLAKRNANNRVAIAEAGAIPLLVDLLSTTDPLTQEHAVTALLNLSICDNNKRSIMSCRAVPAIVHVLKWGSMEARENAAATLFSLSVVDEYKIMIGASGAILPLIALLNEGTQRGKKDAATALFNLCFFQGNKIKAVRGGVVSILVQLLTESRIGMVDEALAILAILASNSEGRAAIGAAESVPILVNFIGTGSPRNRENAAAVLVHLCMGDKRHLVKAKELGVIGLLMDLAENGTDRGKRKATQLLDQINRFTELQKEAEVQSQSQTQLLLPPPLPSTIGDVES
ncbi:U-box domain-containing protein 13-like [Benincasa hispida]|uniref:U-box domain-containing protein 13-like n=1 Tax=Benincasa hispida TaxID=102211 RepID=UPI0018FFBA7E|nr:U-box domain-containing protein 13-like [Benincasa hispida]XP_038901465.1 U-box domain-containing protein 13-like [Benincasa hispida]